MNNIDYMPDGLPLYRIDNHKTIFLNSTNAIKNGNEYTFNIRNMNIYKPSTLSLDTFIFNNTSNYNYFNEIKLKGINVNPQSYINSDFNGHPTIASIVFDSNNIPSTYITPTLITDITPIESGNNVIYNLTSNTSNTTYSLTLPYDTIGDILLVGSGGYGGSNAYSGGGGAGELIYINNYYMPSGTYSINIKDNVGYTPTDVRQYPPKTYQTETGNITINANLYTQTITLDTSGITYGSGNYVITASSYTVGSGLEILFNRVITTSPNYLTATSRYDVTTGIYTGNNYLVTDTFKGEWIHIKLPVAISLCYYNFVSNGAVSRNPSLFKIYGSNDSINWTEIIQASNSTTPLTSTDYPNYFGIGYSSTTNVLPRYKKILSTPSLPYQYFGIVVNKIVTGSGETRFGLNEWELFGFEDSYSNAITKLNILSHYRDFIPKVYTSVADLGTTTQNGSTNYRWSLTLDSSSVETNEAGTYEITCTGSAGYTTSHPYSILTRTTNASTFTCNTTNSYTAGVYNAGKYLVNGYFGEWFYVKLLSTRLLYGFSIMIGSQLANLMGEWKFYGSMSGNDGSWVEITDGSQSTRIANTDYIQNGSYYYYSKYFTNPTSYLYYGFCCNKLTTTGTTTLTWGNELYLLTKDVLTITDKPNILDGSVSLIRDNTTLLTAKAGGNGGWLFNTNTNILPTSGGSGGGGYYKRFLNSVICYYLFNTSNLGLDGLNTYNLTNVSSVVQNTTDKRFGVSSAQFSGSNYFVINNGSHFQPDILSIVGWIKGSTSATYQCIINTRPTSGRFGYLIYILPTTGYLSFWTGGDTAWYMTDTNINIGDGYWHHFVCMYDRTAGRHKIWIDNVLKYNLTGKQCIASNIEILTIGCLNNFGTKFNNGTLLDSFYLFNRELTTDEINYLYTTGDYLNQSGANAGTPFNNIYTTGQIANGSNGTTTQGGNGGGVSYVSSISGSSISYSVGGTGATDVSTPVSKVAGTGDGGDGNNGNPASGSVSLLLKNVIDYDAYKYINNSGIEIEPQNISQLTVYNPNVNNTNLNFNMTLQIQEL